MALRHVIGEPDLEPVEVAYLAGLPRTETHISSLYLAGDLVYKRKKDVRFGFVDLSTPEAREATCRREVELNRRLAPDIYLGVAPLIEAGRVIDHVVVMRRMPEGARLTNLLRGPGAAWCVRDVARAIATFHAGAATGSEISRAGAPEAIHRMWEDNLSEIARFVPSLLPPDGVDRARALALRYISGREPLLHARVLLGRIRDGHGDLLADDIYCLTDGPRILDCIEFDDRLRQGDTIADIAFLAMDLRRLGHADLAQRFLAWYREYSADAFPQSLAEHYIAYRALVRAKVACLRAEQGAPDAAAEAAALLSLSLEGLERGRVAQVLVGGLPGTGKSTLALSLADALGAALIRADEVRKDLAGIGHTAHVRSAYGDGIYSSEMTALTYGEMLVRARRALAMGESVVLDASFTDARMRLAAMGTAAAAEAVLVQLRCEAPITVAAGRLRERNEDVSDATPNIAFDMSRRADPWPEARPIDTTGPPEQILAAALTALEEEMGR